MSNYPRENLTTSWVLVNRDGEIVETDYLEDYPSSSTPLDNCLSTSTPLEEARETLKRGTEGLSRISIDDQHSNTEDLSEFAVKSEIASESHIPVEEINRSQNDQGVEELSLDAEAKYANSSEKKSSQSVSQYLEETESQGYTDETDSDLIHLSQDDEDSSPGEILELSTGISSNSSQFSYVNSDGILYNDSAQDEVDSDVLVLDSSHDSLDIKSSLSQDALFDATGTIDDSSIPERELIDLSLSPKIRQYIHTPNNRLNVALTIIMMLSVTVVLGLAIGHFLGASRQWMAQTKKAFVLEELRLRNLAEQMPKDSIDFWRKKYKEQLIMNERLKTVLAMDIQQMNRKKMSRKEQAFHKSKLDMISLQIDHLQILKDLQIILMDLQLKEQEQQLNINAALDEKQIVIDNDLLNQNAQSIHSDELIVASDHEDLKNSEERLPLETTLLNDNAEKAETNPTFFETSFIQRVDSEEKGSLIIAVDDDKIDDPQKSYEINLDQQILDDNIVHDYSQKSYEDEINLDQQTLDDKIVNDNPQKSYEDEINVDHQPSIPLLPPPPPPENIVNEVTKANIDINSNYQDSQIKSEEGFSEPQQIKTPSVNVNNHELLVQSLKSRILQLQHENNELRAEMTHLRYKQLNPQTGSQKNLTPTPFQEPLVQNNCKNAESLNVSPDKKCTNNSLFNLSKTLNYYWQQFDKFTSKSIDQHLHNLPGSHLFNTEELVKKLNHTKNAFYTLQSNLAQKWKELGTVKNTSESFHQTDHKVNDPLWKMGDILQQTWNKVKNISQNFFVKEGSTVKKLAKKVSQKLGRIEKMLEKKWSELNEKLNKKVFSRQQRIREHQNIDDFYHWKAADKKWNKKENKIQSRCNKIVEKIKENKVWFNHIQESRNPYFSADFQSWLKEQKFFDDEQETKEFWKSLKKTMKYPDQKELMWLICQYKWWQPNNRNLDVCIDNQNNCKTDKTMENEDLKINKMNTHYSMAQEESPNQIFWVFGRAEDREKQRATPENKNANWFFNRARSRDNLRDRPHPKAEWLFKRAEDRKYQRLFQNEFQDNWKIYDWLNKRAEIRKHLRYLDGFN